MKVMLADVEAGALETAVARLKAQGAAAAGVICDVSRRDAVQAAADATLEAFGKVHVVCNNAGVSVTGKVGELRPRDWDWILDINLKGVIHGTEIFTPLIELHGEGGHFVNTASMGGMISAPTHEPYTATKFAVVEAGISPDVVADMALEAIRAGELYVFTHPEFETAVRGRFNRILAAFERAKLSPVLSGLKPVP